MAFATRSKPTKVAPTAQQTSRKARSNRNLL